MSGRVPVGAGVGRPVCGAQAETRTDPQRNRKNVHMSVNYYARKESYWLHHDPWTR